MTAARSARVAQMTRYSGDPVFDRDPTGKIKYTGQMKKAHYHFTVVLRPEPEGGFTAIVPALPGCVTYGRTLAEAKVMTKDAMSGYIESLRKHGEPVPSDSETLVTT